MRLRGCKVAIVAAIVAVLNSACQHGPVVPSSVLPSKKEREVGEKYVGKTFVTPYRTYLYPGIPRYLSSRSPDLYSRPTAEIPAGTRFVVRRIEIKKGAAGNVAVGIVSIPFGGTPDTFESRDVMVVDIHLESKVYRNVEWEQNLRGDYLPKFDLAAQQIGDED